MKSRLLDIMDAQYLPKGDITESGRWFYTATQSRNITIGCGAKVELLIFDSDRFEADCDEECEATIDIRLKGGAELKLVHVITHDSVTLLNIDLRGDAQCRVTEVMLGASTLKVTSSLMGSNAHFDLNGLFVLVGEQRGSVEVDVNHLHAETTSRTLFKGVASGAARGKFSGMILVEPDAQRILAEQTSRNIVLNEAQILTEPQLEIYADDVKCSHGATVGQLDSDAILYMRQRGLSLEDAKRMQVEGFVSDVVMHAAIERLMEPLQGLLSEKFKQL